PDRYAAEIVRALLEAEPNRQVRGELILKAFARSKGLYLPTALVDSLISDRSDARQPLLSESDVQAIRQGVIERLNSVEPLERLMNHPRLGYLLSRWRDWSVGDSPIAAAKKIASSPEGAYRLARAFASRGLRSGGPDDPGGLFFDLDLSKLAAFVPLDLMWQMLQRFDATALTGEDQLAFEAIRER